MHGRSRYWAEKYIVLHFYRQTGLVFSGSLMTKFNPYTMIMIAALVKGFVGVWLYSTAGGTSPLSDTVGRDILRPHVRPYLAAWVFCVFVFCLTTATKRCTITREDVIKRGGGDQQIKMSHTFSEAVEAGLLQNMDYDYQIDEFELLESWLTGFRLRLAEEHRDDYYTMPPALIARIELSLTLLDEGDEGTLSQRINKNDDDLNDTLGGFWQDFESDEMFDGCCG